MPRETTRSHRYVVTCGVVSAARQAIGFAARRTYGEAMTSRPADIHKITGARRSLSEDIKARQTRYLLSMGIRTACFLLAIVTPSPFRWFFFAAAVVLPYLAVVIANGGREPAPEAPRMADPHLLGIEAPPVRRPTIVYEEEPRA